MQHVLSELAVCWLDPTCLAAMVAVVSGLLAVARRLQKLDDDKPRSRSLGRTVRLCCSGGLTCGCVGFGLALIGGSLWPQQLKPVAGVTIIACYAIDWTSDFAVGLCRSIVTASAKAYLTKTLGVDLDKLLASSEAEKNKKSDTPQLPPV